MKTITSKHLARSIAAIALAAAGSSAFAVSTWNFGSVSGNCSDTVALAGTCAAQAGSDAGAPSVTGAAFSSTGSSGANFAIATLGSYGGGFGVTASGESTGNPQHTTDNSGSTDAVLLGFGGKAFALGSVKMGYIANSAAGQDATSDADISVFRYVGVALTPVVSGVALTGMAAASWELVGNYADLVSGTAKSVNTTGKTSSWWLISAYNSTYGTASGADQGAANSGGTTGLQNGNDYFKLLSVAGGVKTNKTPEPSSLALMGLALVGMVTLRRRQKATGSAV